MVGAVILAAGESQRMGEPKLLMKIGRKRMIERVIDSFRDAVDDLIVVLGYNPKNLVPILKQLGVRWVINKNYREGMVSSFKAGLEGLKGCDAVFLALGDQPFVDRDFLSKAIDAWRVGAKVVSPVYKGKKGHPVLFDRSLFDEILALQKNEFIRDVIHRHGEDHRVIEAGEWAVTDLDTPESLRVLREKS